MSQSISSFLENHVIALNDQTRSTKLNCSGWRIASRGRNMIVWARVSQQVASTKAGGTSLHFRAPTPQHLMLQGGHRRPSLAMDQHSNLSLGPSLQQLSISAAEFTSRQPEEARRQSSMEGVRRAIATLSQVTSEVKVYLCRTYSAVCNIADQNKEQNMEFKYVHSRLSCVESRLEDVERNTIELLGKVDSIKEDLSVFISKTQYSQMQEAPSVNQGRMEAVSVLQQNYR